MSQALDFGVSFGSNTFKLCLEEGKAEENDAAERGKVFLHEREDSADISAVSSNYCT